MTGITQSREEIIHNRTPSIRRLSHGLILAAHLWLNLDDVSNDPVQSDDKVAEPLLTNPGVPDPVRRSCEFKHALICDKIALSHRSSASVTNVLLLPSNMHRPGVKILPSVHGKA